MLETIKNEIEMAAPFAFGCAIGIALGYLVVAPAVNTIVELLV